MPLICTHLPQIRRNTRLRREYLYRKSLETKERSIFERKQKIKEAIERKLQINCYFYFIFTFGGCRLRLVHPSQAPFLLSKYHFHRDRGKAYTDRASERRRGFEERPTFRRNSDWFVARVFPFLCVLHGGLANNLNLLFILWSSLDPGTHVDDEYARAGVFDPKILITTSRDPSSRLQQFSKEMRLVFPNSQRINRGNHVMKQIVDACKANEVTDLIILHEHRGQPDGMVVCHFPYGPTAYFSLHNVVLRHDIKDQGTVSEAFPHLIFNNFNSKLGQRHMVFLITPYHEDMIILRLDFSHSQQVTNILKYLFPVPKDDSKRVMTFSNENDYISYRHHVFVKTSHKDVQLAEVGPRFEMRRTYTSLSLLVLCVPTLSDLVCSDYVIIFSLSNQTRHGRLDRRRYRMGIAAVPADGEEERAVVKLGGDRGGLIWLSGVCWCYLHFL
ncbi:anticodon-binding protein [Jimgerdemannia flammicorona]|uniref:U3 small nucleolar ribonucleoprotein protein IMP4 n=1 Tax=Jimgerdemannia flammicorona TaxID=994334 RepID=A0A433QL03_9FUNG|nr:anticodon-binding protein [Jimgerdemannia flammicorona]